MRIAYIFASRSRPEKFYKCLDNIREMSASKNYFVWAKIDVDDPAIEKYKDRLHEYPEVKVKLGLSQNKVHAINRSMKNLPQCDILIVMSDDMWWEAFGFDDEIRSAFEKHLPNFDGVLHYPEPKSGSRTMVLTIMGINLFKQLGYLYLPDYESVYADDDLTQLTKKMNKYVFVDKNLYSHRHPIWKLCDWDEQYRHTERPDVYEKDKAVYKKRQLENFGL